MEIKTAEQFFRNSLVQSSIDENGNYSICDIEDAMIEFAKYHVNLALQSAVKNAELIKDGRKTEYLPTGSGFKSTKVLAPIYKVDKDSILNAYPLDNIV